MLLAIDIGNTNIVAGTFDGDRLTANWRLATDIHRTSDEYALMVDGLLRLSGLSPADVRGVVLCSVVPAARATVSEGIRRHLHLEPMVISAQLDLGIQIRYSPSSGVGMDRIANAVAVVQRYGTPAVVVDFGTTTNFDAISSDGAYVGGALAPGLEISVEALYAQTAQLTPVPLDAPAKAVGDSTMHSLQSGIIYGYAGLVDGLVDRFRRELGSDLTVVATGGLADRVAPHARSVHHIDPDLTLYGLYLLYHRNKDHAGS